MLIIKGFIFCILIMQAKCRDDLCSLQHFCECPPYLTQAHAPLYFTKHNYIQQYAIVGKYKELHCCLGPRFQEILWSKDGVQFPWTQDRHAIVYSSNQSLLILEVKPEDSGEYKCKARFGDEYIEHTTRLSNFPAPVFTHKPIWNQEPQSAEIFVGEDFFLSCSATVGQQYNSVSLEPVQTAWYRFGEEVRPVLGRNVSRTWLEDDIVVQLQLEFAEVTDEDSGEYTCKMENQYGFIEKTVTLKIINGTKEMYKTQVARQEFVSLIQQQFKIYSSITRQYENEPREVNKLMKKLEEKIVKTDL